VTHFAAKATLAKHDPFVMPGRFTYILLASFCLMASSLFASAALADRQQDPELGRLLKQALKERGCFEDKYDQQVWLAAMEPQLQRVVKHPGERADILYHVHCEARRLNLPPGLVMAVIDVESRFDRWAVSHAGAVGLMQIMPFWPRELGMTNDELVRIPQNIRMGCTILRFYLDREKGDYTKALARYNGSVGRRNYSDLVLSRLAKRWQYD
jgi:soluble lytic murein transglycosylase-like protein